LSSRMCGQQKEQARQSRDRWYASTGSQKKIKKKHFREAAQDLLRRKYIYISANPLAKVLGLHATKGFYIQKKKLKAIEEPKSMPPQHFAPW
jgi:hypothetical protein